ncbi:MAG: thioredoxin [Candidatus Krumholzibacteria bacterium]|nr:thioredoxin [Candidatus Krumholzibacteria bacterium]
MKVTKITDSDFNARVIESENPAVVDFWATWCVPCRKLDETLEKMADEYNGRVSFYKVDVNESNATTSKYYIRNIPMLLFFNGGEVVDQAVGSLSREMLEEKLNRLLE